MKAIAARIARAYFNWLNALIARHAPDRAVFVVLQLPRVNSAEVGPPIDGHAATKQLGSTDQIVSAIDGMRSVMNNERTLWPGAGSQVFVCCDCGMAHRFDYRPVVDESNHVVLDVTTSVDAQLGAQIRGTYSFPFTKARPTRVLGYLGGTH